MTGPIQDTFGQYMKATGLGQNAKAMAAQDKYGLNMFEVPVPPFLALLKDHLVAPFFCFQVCVLRGVGGWEGGAFKLVRERKLSLCMPDVNGLTESHLLLLIRCNKCSGLQLTLHVAGLSNVLPSF
jgi:hypothetical protein